MRNIPTYDVLPAQNLQKIKRTAEDRAEDSIDMARIVFGRDFADQNCVILGKVNVNWSRVRDGTKGWRSLLPPKSRASRICGIDTFRI